MTASFEEIASVIGTGRKVGAGLDGGRNIFRHAYGWAGSSF